MRFASEEPNDGGRDPFKAVGDPVRRRLVEALATGEKPVEVLAQLSGVPYGSVSQHLQILLAARIVVRRAEGRRRYYRLRPETLADMAGWLDRMRSQWAEALEGLEAFLDRRP